MFGLGKVTERDKKIASLEEDQVKSEAKINELKKKYGESLEIKNPDGTLKEIVPSASSLWPTARDCAVSGITLVVTGVIVFILWYAGVIGADSNKEEDFTQGSDS